VSDNNKSKETVTKEKIAARLSEDLGLSHILCEEISYTIFQEIVDLVKAEKKITLKNFGKFYINHKKSRPGLNIRTKDVVAIAPRDVLRFTPSRLFKSKINGDEK
jgi:nucleoid DNA-binding protein